MRVLMLPPRGRGRPLRGRGRRCASSSSRRRRVRDEPAVAHEDEVVGALRLVHDVARDEQRGAVVGEAAEGRPEVAAEHGVETDGRLVEDEQLGLAEQRGGERDAGALAAGERRRRPGRRGCRGRRPRSPRRRARRARRGCGRSSARFSRTREVGVDRRRLGHVADPAAELGRAGRKAEHGDGRRTRRSARRRSRASASTCRSRSGRAGR